MWDFFLTNLCGFLGGLSERLWANLIELEELEDDERSTFRPVLEDVDRCFLGEFREGGVLDRRFCVGEPLRGFLRGEGDFVGDRFLWRIGEGLDVRCRGGGD